MPEPDRAPTDRLHATSFAVTRDLGETSVKAVIRETLLATGPLAGRRVVDLGCGNGALTAWLRREGAAAVGVEPEQGLIAAARRRHGGAWIAAAAERLPLATASFDAAIFFNSLHHVAAARQVAALAEAARLLRPGGDLVVIEPAAAGSYFALLQPLDDETQVRAAAERALRAVAGRLLEPVGRGRFATFLTFADAAAVLAAFSRADAARASRVAPVRRLIEQRFLALGESLDDGRRRFLQPMLFGQLRQHRSTALTR